MADSKYLDTLSSGMRARIDPAYRLARQNKLAEIVIISHGSPGSSGNRSSLRPVNRHKSLDEFKIRLTEF